MLFHAFSSQAERQAFGGSAFIELQFCKLPARMHTKKLMALDNINFWQDDSLYIIDETAFYQAYSHIFDCGTYHNLKRGIVDLYGFNYYAPKLINPIIEKLHQRKPDDYQTLLPWLAKASSYNGFYILGL